jgi:hypothetical protein
MSFRLNCNPRARPAVTAGVQQLSPTIARARDEVRRILLAEDNEHLFEAVLFDAAEPYETSI